MFVACIGGLLMIRSLMAVFAKKPTSKNQLIKESKKTYQTTQKYCLQIELILKFGKLA